MKHIVAFGVIINVMSIYLNIVCLLADVGPAWLRSFFVLASCVALWFYKRNWYDLTH